MSILQDDAQTLHPTRRIAPTDPLGAIWWTTVMATVVWMFVPVVYLIITRGGETVFRDKPPNVESLPPRDIVAMVIGGAGTGLLVLLLLGAVTVWPNGLEKLGFAPGKLRRGATTGLIGAAIVIPLMVGIMLGTEWLWNRLEYKHPTEHDLLQILGGSSNPLLSVLIIASAVLLAPMFEEFLFRGFLQTAILATLMRSTPADRPVRAGARWTAIVLASIAFTAVHQHFWMMPPIFVLSLCLGYAYERTSNLWTPIIIHAMFNGASTLLFLVSR